MRPRVVSEVLSFYGLTPDTQEVPVWTTLFSGVLELVDLLGQMGVALRPWSSSLEIACLGPTWVSKVLAFFAASNDTLD